MEQILLNKLILEAVDIPTEKESGHDEFWGVVSSLGFKDSVMILLLANIPSTNPADMSNEECRSVLASVWTMKQLLFSSRIFKAALEKTTELPQTDSTNIDDIKTPFTED